MTSTLDRLRLTAALQPVVGASTGAVAGFEALLRPFCGPTPVEPALLFGASADRASVRRLDVLAHEVALRTGAEHLGAGLLFVNVSAATLNGHWGWLSTLAATARSLRIEPGQVVLEVTEQHRPDLRLLPQLRTRSRDLGLRLALDDLGEGHATMATLDALRPDLVKLAPWAARISPDDVLGGVVGSIVDECHARGMTVVAEGVEHEVQRAALVRLGVDLLQGYLVGRPQQVPVAA